MGKDREVKHGLEGDIHQNEMNISLLLSEGKGRRAELLPSKVVATYQRDFRTNTEGAEDTSASLLYQGPKGVQVTTHTDTTLARPPVRPPKYPQPHPSPPPLSIVP